MIFVTVGTQDVPFNRLLKAVEEQINEKNITEEVIVQSGKTSYTSNKMKIVNLLEMTEFKKIINDSTLVICHGGVGTILDALSYGKTVIACPRLQKFGEHVNDHQLQIINRFAESGYIIPCLDMSDLEKCLNEAKTFKPKKFESNTKNMVGLVDKYINVLTD